MKRILLTLVLLPLPIIGTHAANAAAVPARDTPLLGKYESTQDDFSRPTAVDISDDGAIAIADSVARHIRVRRAGASEWITLTGPDDHPLIAPAGVTWVADDALIVTDRATDDFALFSLNETQNAASNSDLAVTDAHGRVPAGLYRPAGVASYLDRVAVADTGNNRIVIANAGNTIALDSRGSEPGQFKRPLDVAFDEQGRLYVADTGNHRIQWFNSQGEFQGEFGSLGSDPGQFAFPMGLAFDSKGNLYVADTNNHRIQKIGPAQNVLQLIPEDPTQGNRIGHFNTPQGVAVDPYDNIFVADT
ncbi:MAG: NHL repeat-containing protein, partial [Phycisphaerales bacterium]|nr:NHL repeat-containing protein [Phycisphaerales bacterium]